MVQKVSLREKRSQALRQRIYAAAREVFSEKGFHDATLDEIAARVDMAKGSIYHYITSKSELLLECYLERIEQFVEKLQQIANSAESPVVKLRTAISVHVDTMIRYSFTPVLIQPRQVLGERHEEMVHLRHEVEKSFLQIIEEGIASGVFVTDDAEAARNLILGSVNWMPNWYRSVSARIPKQVMIAFASNFLTSPFLAQSGPPGIEQVRAIVKKTE